MNAANITSLLTMIGCEKIRSSGALWVKACCPLAPWTHREGKDESPSFAVSVHDDAMSKFKCHACQSKGTLAFLVDSIRKRSGRDLSKVADFIAANDSTSVAILQKRVQASSFWGKRSVEVGGVIVDNPPMSVVVPADGKALENFVPEEELSHVFTTEFPPVVLEYLTTPKGVLLDGDVPARGLTPETIKLWELCWHPKAKRIGVPVRDTKGRLVSISGRRFYSYQKPKFLHTTGFNRDFYLYGEDKVEKGGLCILVEGFFDVQRIRQVGFPIALGVMGSYLSVIQAEKICQWFDRVLIIPDGDKAGHDAAKQWTQMLAGRLPTYIAPVSEGSDPDDNEHDQIEEHVIAAKAA